jgi:23S rRNA pseudouridine1911/1915/1917 synthase
MNLNYKVEKSMTINQILNEHFDISARLKNKLIKNKYVLRNGYFEDTRTVVNIGDIITIILDSPEDNSNIVPSEMNLNIVYEDSHLLVLNKPAGIAVHPSILHFDNSISNGIKYYFDSIGLHKKIRPVNRIDLNTSGLVLFAKNEYVKECLIKQMASRMFEKTYICIVNGILDNKKRNY